MYFVTICVKDRQPILCEDATQPIRCSDDIVLSPIGRTVNEAICNISGIYSCVKVEKYCIMPEHIHMIVQICADMAEDKTELPSLSTIIGQMKRWVSVSCGETIWQKSFVDPIIRNEKEYLAIWRYIDNNPRQLDAGEEHISDII